MEHSKTPGAITSSADARQSDTLADACARRNPADIEFELDNGDFQFGRIRLLKCDGEQLYIERPSREGVPLEVPSGTPVVVHFMLDGERYAFHSRVAEECRVRLGQGRPAIAGLAVELPDQVHRCERRTDLRVSLARFEDVRAAVRLVDCDQESPCFVARLMNISAGGVAAILLDMNGHGHQITQGDRLDIEFDLPTLERHFKFKTALCHRRCLDGAGFVAGLRYLPESSPALMRHAIRQISQFVAKEVKRSDPQGQSPE